MKQTIVLTTLALALTGAFAGQAEAAPNTGLNHPATGTADDFFGITNLYTFHLTIAADQWAVMEEPDEVLENPMPFEGNPGGPERDPLAPTPERAPPPPRFGPGANGPMMGSEFKKGAATLQFEGQPFGEIRVRFKGHSSYRFARNSLKRSLKLDFNDLEKGRTFFGLTKLNLNNNAMDPSQMREALAYHIFRNGGVPAGRTAFARVFLTIPGQYDRASPGYIQSSSRWMSASS